MSTYCTPNDVRANTRNTELETATDAVIEELILQAELVIDNYVGFVNTDTTATLKFPRPEDNSTIPTAVKFATIYQVEYMFESSPDLEHGIHDESGSKNNSSSNFSIVSHRTKQMLIDYRTIVGKPFTIRQDVVFY